MNPWCPFGIHRDDGSDYEPSSSPSVMEQIRLRIWPNTDDSHEQPIYMEIVAFAEDAFAACMPLAELIDQHLSSHLLEGRNQDAKEELVALRDLRSCLDALIKAREEAKTA